MARRVRLSLGLATLLAIGQGGIASPVSAAAGDLLPDLTMTPPYGLDLTTSPAGAKKLRFGSIVNNIGDGAMEIRASERDGKFMNNVRQWIYNTSGGGRSAAKPHAVVRYSSDGHNHFHVQRFIKTKLTPISAPGASGKRTLRKIGFCLVDSQKMTVDVPPNTPSSPRYFGCGTLQSKEIKIGISVGWGDNYPPYFAHQAIDVTGLPAGSYLLCAKVNPIGMWTEKTMANNSYWVQMNLDVANDSLTVTGDGAGPC